MKPITFTWVAIAAIFILLIIASSSARRSAEPPRSRWEFHPGPNGVPMRVNVGTGEAQLLRILPSPPAIGEDLQPDATTPRR